MADQEPQQGPDGAEQDFDFDQSFQRVAGAPCKVERIMLHGLQRTKASVVQAELLRLKEARTLEEIRDAALAAYEELMALDIFDAVDLVLVEHPKVLRPLPAAPASNPAGVRMCGINRCLSAAPPPAHRSATRLPGAGRRRVQPAGALPGEGHAAPARGHLRARHRR